MSTATVVLGPPKTTLDPLVQDVLDWVNEKRAEQGLDALTNLKPGRTGVANGCPVALSLENDAMVCPWGWTYGMFGSLHPIPTFVTDFILRFDAQVYPQYIESTSQGND